MTDFAFSYISYSIDINQLIATELNNYVFISYMHQYMRHRLFISDRQASI